MHNHWDLENSWADWDEIWHEGLGWVWDGYQFIPLINFELPYFVYLSIYLSFLFVLYHRDLKNLLADWDEIWHKHMERDVGFYVIKIRIAECFAYQSTFSIYA